MIDKSKFLDSKGAPITQGLFLETSYHNTDHVIYTLKSRDYEYKGRKLRSIKKLFLEMEDPTEYSFANRYFLDWDHWQRIRKNAIIAKHLEGWSEELEVKLRSQAILDIRGMAAEERGFQAAKWIADKGWDKRAPGRPTNEAKQKEEAIKERIANEFAGDLERIGR